MCGRMVQAQAPEDLAEMFEALPANDLPAGPRFNVCPTQDVAAVISTDGARRLVPLRWGFVPEWYQRPSGGPLLINARAETVAEKPAFRAAIRARRCLVPADGYYEWEVAPDGTRLPWYVRRTDGAPMALAGLWQVWERGGERLVACATLTTAAGPATAHIHHREPVMIERAGWPLWLGEAGHGAARLMRSSAAGAVTAHRVGTAVNSNRAEGAGLVAPV